jgi:hypothetical protein
LRRAHFVAAALALTGCKEREQEGPPAPPSSAPPISTTPLVGSSARAAVPSAAAWYAGSWHGTYESSPHRIELSAKQGGLPEWAVDDGHRGTGSGTLTLTPGADGTATGTAQGPLGSAELRGAFDGDTLALRLVPTTDDGAFSGVMVAHRDGERVIGTFQASTPDGRVAREGKVALTRVP